MYVQHIHREVKSARSLKRKRTHTRNSIKYMQRKRQKVITTSVRSGLLLLPKLKASLANTTDHDRPSHSGIRIVEKSPEIPGWAISIHRIRCSNTTRLKTATMPVFITSVCPGYYRSDLSRSHQSWAMKVVRVLANAFLRAENDGIRVPSLVSGTTLGEQSHGGLCADD